MSVINNNFYGKRVVVFCPVFFHYHEKIKEQLIKMGAESRLYDDRASNGFIFKVLLRLNWRFLINRIIISREKKILKEIFDYQPNFILFVNPESPTSNFVERVSSLVKSFDSTGKTIVYMWDSLRNKKCASAYIPVVDKFVTFDRFDANALGLDFLPLFYTDEYAQVGVNKDSCEIKYDIGFIGTLHSGRSFIFDKIVEAINSKSSYRFLYCPSRILFFIRRYVLRQHTNLKFKDVSFTPLSSVDSLNVISSAKCILDVPHAHQVGLTMRMLEMLGAKKKVVTTAQDVVNYDFYKKSNIYLLTDFNANDLASFLELPYEPLDEEIYRRYSLESWLNQLFF